MSPCYTLNKHLLFFYSFTEQSVKTNILESKNTCHELDVERQLVTEDGAATKSKAVFTKNDLPRRPSSPAVLEVMNNTTQNTPLYGASKKFNKNIKKEKEVSSRGHRSNSRHLQAWNKVLVRIVFE